MTDTSKREAREALIEKAAKAIYEADPPNNPHGPDSDLVFDEPYTRAYSANLRIHARAALAVFEQANSKDLRVAASTPTDHFRHVTKMVPTDDEREALACLIADAEAHPNYQRPTHVVPLAGDYRAADAVLSFRRTAVQEPTAADEVLKDLVIRLNNEAYGKPDFTWGQVQRQIQGVEMARAALRAEWEAEGRRWYAACWRDDNGYLNSLESSTVAREYAEADVTRWRAAEAKEDGGQPDRIVLATKIEYPWMPVPDTTGAESEGKS